MTDESAGHGKGGIMNMPSFTADASLYQARNHYRSAAAGRFLDDGRATVTPQGCGWVEGGLCGTLIGVGAVACAALCLEGGPGPCAGCWSVYLGGLYQLCHDCIPAWMRALIDAFEGNGGGGGGGGGPVPQCCPQGRTCRCGGRCVTNPNGTISCVNGECLTPNQQCQ
jgi:hypothetical protein